MKKFKNVCIQKIRGFRPTIVSMIMILLTTIRLFCSGKGIMIAGICASIVPFMCQLRNYPTKEEQVSEQLNVLADYFLNIFYMLIYLGYTLLVTWAGWKLNPAYAPYPYFWQTMLLAVCANMILMSVMYTIGAGLSVKQRMMVGIILINAQLGVMLLSESIVSGHSMITMYCIGFIALIFVLTLSTVSLSYPKSGTAGNKNRMSKWQS